MTGPREYDAGTRAALFAMANGTCFFPGCPHPVLTMVGSDPVISVDIAHIKAATPGGPRFDPNMTNEERAAHPNVILLCTAHHKVVDRDPDTYTVEVLTAWKTEREGPNLNALRGLSGLTEERLAEMIEDVVRSSGFKRLVELDFDLGLLVPGQGIAYTPPAQWAEFVRRNPGFGEKLAVVTARNTGTLRSTVASFWVVVSGSRESQTPELVYKTPRMDANPTLPVTLEVGDAARWLTYFNDVVRLCDGLKAEGYSDIHVWARASLGTGETIESAKHPVALVIPGQ